jgi:hypothetical protein
MTVIIDGTAGITFPVVAGSASAVQASSGRVLQVVNSILTGQISSSSSTFANTGLAATITPSSSTSKILVFVDIVGCSHDTGNTAVQLKVLRGSTQIVYIEDYAGNPSTTSATGYTGGSGCNYLDSPATTSATTYVVQLASRSNVAAVYINNYGGNNSATSTITLMEIAA